MKIQLISEKNSTRTNAHVILNRPIPRRRWNAYRKALGYDARYPAESEREIVARDMHGNNLSITQTRDDAGKPAFVVHPLVGVMIRRLRIRNKKTQTELAGFIGTTQSEISEYENSRVEPELPTLRKLAAALEVPLAVLIGE